MKEHGSKQARERPSKARQRKASQDKATTRERKAKPARAKAKENNCKDGGNLVPDFLEQPQALRVERQQVQRHGSPAH